MKVIELIAKLYEFDEESKVTLSGDWYGEGHMYVDWDEEIKFDE